MIVDMFVDCNNVHVTMNDKTNNNPPKKRTTDAYVQSMVDLSKVNEIDRNADVQVQGMFNYVYYS